MPSDPLESMLQTMMKRMLNSDARVLCCKGKNRGQKSSHSRCKCRSSRSNNEQSKHNKRKKLKTSSLKTIVCVAKMAKDGSECLDCACHGRAENPIDAEDERFCSKCGQLLPGAKRIIPPTTEREDSNSKLNECLDQLEHCKQECNKIKKIESNVNKHAVNTGVQVNVGRKEPVKVQIRVCPCPNSTKNHGHLNHSRSEPDMSKANVAYDYEESSDTPPSKVLFEDDYKYAPPQSGPPGRDRITAVKASRPDSVGFNQTSTDWQTDVTTMKRLALKMAKARLVEDSARWERETASRVLRRQEESLQYPEEHDQRTSKSFDDPRETVRRVTQPPDCETRTPRYSVPINADVGYDQSLGTVNYGQHGYVPSPNSSTGCCTATGSYCYNPAVPSTYGEHCENKCTCSNYAQFMPYQQHPGQFAAGNSQFQ